ncbi:MAG: gliding motility protein GldM [Sphingobacteriia bacterium]|nr:gliding motility protein GldM [Sphingobacteriia bacterium]
MAGFKETPRQKMIGMMYLVLTALLALNVSKDILTAFVTVNKSMEETNANFKTKLDETYAKFDQQKSLSPDKVTEYWQKAQDAKKLSQDLVDYLRVVRNEVITATDRNVKSVQQADTTDLKDIASKDNFDAPTLYFLGTDVTKGKADEMIQKFAAFRTQMTGLVKTDDQAKLQLGLNTEGKFIDEYGKSQSWKEHYFNRTILAADLVLLNKFIAEIRNAEYDVVSRLYTYISATDFKFSEISAKVIPLRQYVFKGESFEAEVLVAAYDTTGSPKVMYRMGSEKWTGGTGTLVPGERGLVNLKIGTGGMNYGEQKYAGVIIIKNPQGIEEERPFSGSFVVQEPLAVISPDKVSVLYAGLNNPVSVSVPGVPASAIDLKLAGGNAKLVKGEKGQYLITPNDRTQVKLEVTASIGKEIRKMGERIFRVMPVPAPVAIVGGKKSMDAISTADLQRAQISAVLRDFLFDDVRYEVISFSIGATINGSFTDVAVVGNKVNADAVSRILNRVGARQLVTFSNIKVKGPDGVKAIDPVVLKTL